MCRESQVANPRIAGNGTTNPKKKISQKYGQIIPTPRGSILHPSIEPPNATNMFVQGLGPFRIIPCPAIGVAYFPTKVLATCSLAHGRAQHGRSQGLHHGQGESQVLASRRSSWERGADGNEELPVVHQSGLDVAIQKPTSHEELWHHGEQLLNHHRLAELAAAGVPVEGYLVAYDGQILILEALANLMMREEVVMAAV